MSIPTRGTALRSREFWTSSGRAPCPYGGRRTPVCLIWRRRNCPLALRCLIACVVGSGFPGLAAAQGATHLSPALGQPPPPVLTLEGAIVWGLQNNPEMAAFRQQHGVAAA